MSCRTLTAPAGGLGYYGRTSDIMVNVNYRLHYLLHNAKCVAKDLAGTSKERMRGEDLAGTCPIIMIHVGVCM